MPLQNRVTPEGEIVSLPARGTMMGNRGGALHDEHRSLARRRWVSRQWICCLLEFNGRHRQVMAPRRYTELFFLDEATALAAGHRPCFECRRAAFMQFAGLWASVRGEAGRATADGMDRVLHADRVDATGGKLTYQAAWDQLPEGTLVRFEGAPHLTLAGSLMRWSPEGYLGRTVAAPGKHVAVLTPRCTVDVLAAGYVPLLHPSATA